MQREMRWPRAVQLVDSRGQRFIMVCRGQRFNQQADHAVTANAEAKDPVLVAQVVFDKRALSSAQCVGRAPGQVGFETATGYEAGKVSVLVHQDQVTSLAVRGAFGADDGD